MTEDIMPIIRQVTDGNAQAFRRLFELYAPKVHSFALRLTQCEVTAEEIVQEVFMKVWVTRHALPSVQFFPAYLFAITRNYTLNMLKRLAFEEKAKRSFVQDMKQARCDIEDTLVYSDYTHILERAVDALPPQQKLVYSMCRGEGLKYEEVAERLRISRLTVKTHMHQALKSIKSHFGFLAKAILPLLFFCN